MQSPRSLFNVSDKLNNDRGDWGRSYNIIHDLGISMEQGYIRLTLASLASLKLIVLGTLRGGGGNGPGRCTANNVISNVKILRCNAH